MNPDKPVIKSETSPQDVSVASGHQSGTAVNTDGIKKSVPGNKSKKSANRLLRAALVCILLIMPPLAVGISFIKQPLLLSEIDNLVYDTMLQTITPGQPSDVPVIVDIDEKSLQALGQFPWPRYQMADLIASIAKAGPAAIGIDVLFPESDQTSPEKISKELKEKFGIEARFENIPEPLLNNDKALAKVLELTPSVLGGYFVFGSDKGRNDSSVIPPFSPVIMREEGAPELEQSLWNAGGILAPIELLAKTAPFGFINVGLDSDGAVRHAPLLIQHQGRVYPSLGLQAALLALKVKHPVLKIGKLGTSELRLGKHATIPLLPGAHVALFFRGPQGVYPYYSAVDVMEGRVSPDKLAGKTVFIGTTAVGLKDLRATPFDSLYPGVEAHATLVDMIFSNHFLTYPAHADLLQLTTVFAIGLLLATAFLFAKPAQFALLAVGAGLFICLGSWSLLEYKHIYFSPFYPLLTLIAGSITLVTFRYWQEERQKKYLRDAFSHYVAPELVTQIVNNPSALALEGEDREVTILFSDLMGFTSAAETMPPEQAVSILNRYFTPMTKIIRNQMGTLDKLIGDAIMAFWNAPLEVPDHPARGVAAVLEMREAMFELNKNLQQEFNISLRAGVGLHLGNVRVGNMGSDDLMNYTIIGDNVNLASRLEGLTRHYGVFAITSEAMRKGCGDKFAFVPLDRVLVKGRAEPVDIHTFMDWPEYRQREAEIESWKKALSLYVAGHFAQSRELCQQLAQDTPHKLYHVFSERCLLLEQNPPAGQWDGVFVHKDK